MKERPILFSAPMVRAILSGAKTQTRRVVKPQYVLNGGDPGDAGVISRLEREYGPPIESNQYGVSFDCDGVRGVVSVPMNCPYGAPGDRLFVKETWRTALDLDRLSPLHIAEKCIDAGYPKPWAPLKYEADNVEVNRFGLHDLGDAWGKTRVSIHMPRWASRITLEITGVRVERLQAITEEDARAEGVERDTEPCDHTRLSCEEIGCMGPTYRSTFAELWMQINGAESWDANPWVWVVRFKRLEQS